MRWSETDRKGRFSRGSSRAYAREPAAHNGLRRFHGWHPSRPANAARNSAGTRGIPAGGLRLPWWRFHLSADLSARAGPLKSLFVGARRSVGSCPRFPPPLNRCRPRHPESATLQIAHMVATRYRRCLKFDAAMFPKRGPNAIHWTDARSRTRLTGSFLWGAESIQAPV